jgi:hypothetical protein
MRSLLYVLCAHAAKAEIDGIRLAILRSLTVAQQFPNFTGFTVSRLSAMSAKDNAGGEKSKCSFGDTPRIPEGGDQSASDAPPVGEAGSAGGFP